MDKFKKTFGIFTFLLAIVFLFNSFLAFLILALVGSLIFPKSREYIENKIKLSRLLKNTLILILFPIGLILGIYKTINGMGESDRKAEMELEATLKKQNLSICKVCEDLQNTKDTQKYKESIHVNDDILDDILEKCKECETRKMDKLKDSLNIILQPKKLDVCKVISDLEAIDIECIHKADKKYPNFGIKHTEYTTQCEKENYLVYRKKHNLNEELVSTILSFVMECTENERAEKVMQLKADERAKEDRKEDIEECFKNIRYDLSYKVKESLNNPKSFEEVSCNIAGNDENSYQILFIYRGENPFGAIITKKIIATIETKDCKIVGIQE